MEAILNQKTKHRIALWCFDNLLNVFWTNGRNVTQLAESSPRGISRSSTHVERVCGMTGWLWLLLVVLRFWEQFLACTSFMCSQVAVKPQTRNTRSWTVGALEVVGLVLYGRSFSLARMSLWHGSSSKLLDAEWAIARQDVRSPARCSGSIGLMLHHWRLALTVCLYCFLGFACDAPAQHTIDVWACDIRLYGWYALPTASELWWVLRRYWYNQ